MSHNRWLIISALSNVILASGLVWSLIRLAPALPLTKLSAMPTRSSAPTAPDVASPQGNDSGAREWPRWATQLRAAGISSRALASMVIADFQRRWDQRLNELQHKLEIGEINANTMARLRDTTSASKTMSFGKRSVPLVSLPGRKRPCCTNSRRPACP